MDNEYEIDSFEFEGEETVVSQGLEQEQPFEAEVLEEPVRRQKTSPFADSPYMMYEQVYEKPKKVKQPKKPMGKAAKRILAAALVVALVATGCGVTAFFVNGYWHGQTNALRNELLNQLNDLQQQIDDKSYTGNGNSVSGTGTSTGMTPGQVYAQNVDCIVSVSASDTGSGGSGFIISEDGYVVSNYHVVEGSSRLNVITNDDTTYSATVVGYDAANDVAVLKVEATGLSYAKLGSSDNLIVGDQVVAIGHPLGNETPTLTVGYVSAKDQSVSTDGTIINMLQTDAAINSGNSGGPLFNMNGEVIGITSAKYSGTTSSGAIIEGVGFAIPIDDVVKKMQDLIDYGYVTGAYLGVYVVDVNPDVLDAFGFPAGAYISEIVPGYCASAVGMQAKDMIIAVGKYSVDSVNGLTRALGKFNPGDTTTVTVWRAGAQLEFKVTLDEKPAPETPQDEPSTQPEATQPQQNGFGNWWDSIFGG